MSKNTTEQPGGTTRTTQVNVLNQKKFKCCPATNYTGEVCINCLDRPLETGDQAECCHYRGEPFCAHCSCLWFPFAFVIDVVSCPIRGIKYGISK